MIRTAAALILVIGCSDDEQPRECPTVADSCPSGCHEVWASRLVGDCYAPSAVVGCSTTSAGLTQVFCIKSVATGDLYTIPSTAGLYLTTGPHWAECTNEETNVAFAGQTQCVP